MSQNMTERFFFFSFETKVEDQRNWEMLSLLPVLEFLYSSIRLQSIIVYVSNQMLRKTLCHTFLHPTFVHIIFVH